MSAVGALYELPWGRDWIRVTQALPPGQWIVHRPGQAEWFVFTERMLAACRRVENDELEVLAEASQ